MGWCFGNVCLDNGGEKRTNASTIEKLKCRLSKDFLKKGSSELEQLIIGVGSEYSVLDYLRQGDNVPTSVRATDTILSAWKEKLLRSEVVLKSNTMSK